MDDDNMKKINSTNDIARNRTDFLDSRLNQYKFNISKDIVKTELLNSYLQITPRLIDEGIDDLYIRLLKSHNKNEEELYKNIYAHYKLTNIDEFINYKIGYLKYIIFGLLKNKTHRNKCHNILQNKSDNNYSEDVGSGGNAYDIIDYMIINIFDKDSIDMKNIKYTNLDKMELPTKIYTIYNTDIKINVFMDTIDKLKVKINNGIKYKLVGVIYNCNNHQVASICFNNNCDNDIHTFIDDRTITKSKKLNNTFDKSFLKLGCGYSPNTTVVLLYENEIVINHMNQELSKNPLFINLGKPLNFIHGGFNNNYYYKYIKYKTKYLKLKTID
jgi:hypothetical protein